jgi:hypothetical protein
LIQQRERERGGGREGERERGGERVGGRERGREREREETDLLYFTSFRQNTYMQYKIAFRHYDLQIYLKYLQIL